MVPSNHENSWKNKEVFKKQLELNLYELNQKYPIHWKCFIEFMGIIKRYKPNNILDIGCGCGALSEIIHRYYPSIKYTGIDYSQEAIDIAKQQWPFATFIKKDYKELCKEAIKRFDIINACSLHNVLQNGDEAINFILDLNPKVLLLEKILTTNKESYYMIDTAYNIIPTYRYYHNNENLHKMFFDHDYIYIERVESDSISHYLLRKKEKNV